MRKTCKKDLIIQIIGLCFCYPVLRRKGKAPFPRQDREERQSMSDYEIRYVGGHVEVYSRGGAFLFSADTVREAMEELNG